MTVTDKLHLATAGSAGAPWPALGAAGRRGLRRTPGIRVDDWNPFADRSVNRRDVGEAASCRSDVNARFGEDNS